MQSNAFTIKWEVYDKECWVYYDNIEVCDNKIIYYSYIDDRHNTPEILERAKELNINLIKIGDDDKINKDRYSNYKYIIMINEIIESEVE